MSQELPKGWAKCTLEECADVVMGQSPKGIYVSEGGEGLPFYQGKAEFGTLYPKPRKYCSSPTKIAESGDILLSVRAPVGPTNICPDESCIGRGLAAIRGYEGINQNFLLYYFRNIEPWLGEQGTGSTFKAISGGFLRNIEVIFPPLSEQIRIADKLDRLLASVNAAQSRLDNIPALIKGFRQSVLAAATSGELTREWREERLDGTELPDFNAYWSAYYAVNGSKHKPADVVPTSGVEELPEGWSSRTLGEVCSVYVGATPSRKEPDYWDGDINWVSSSEVAFCRISSTKEHITSDGLKNTSTTVHPPGTVMLAMIGQGKTRGQAAILDIEACHNQNTAALRVPDGLLVSEYLYYFLFFQYEQTRKIGGGNNQQALNKKTIQSIGFPYPPIDEQKEIVRRVESLFALADSVEKQYQDAKARTDRLTQSLLAKAFRGELVPQDPEDESAEQLLEKIKTQKQLKAMKKSIRKKALARPIKATANKLKSCSSGIKPMTLSEAPEHYLQNLLKELGGEADATVLWKKSGLEIDDFYALLKQETAIVDDNKSADPAQRKLKVRQ